MKIKRQPGEALEVYLLRVQLVIALALGGRQLAALKRELLARLDK